jgi:hypothetical protein
MKQNYDVNQRFQNIKEQLYCCDSKDFTKYIDLLINIYKNNEIEHEVIISFCQGVFDRFYTVQLFRENREVSVYFVSEFDKYKINGIINEWRKYYRIA